MWGDNLYRYLTALNPALPPPGASPTPAGPEREEGIGDAPVYRN